MSEEVPELPKSKSFWQEHVKMAQAFKGSDLEYCRLNSLTPSTFSSHKRKLGFVKKTARRKKVNSPFKRIRVEKETTVKDFPQKSTLNHQPPEWVAQFLKEFLS